MQYISTYLRLSVTSFTNGHQQLLFMVLSGPMNLSADEVDSVECPTLYSADEMLLDNIGFYFEGIVQVFNFNINISIDFSKLNNSYSLKVS